MGDLLIRATSHPHLAVIYVDGTHEEGASTLGLLKHPEVQDEMVLLCPLEEERLIVRRLLSKASFQLEEEGENLR